MCCLWLRKEPESRRGHPSTLGSGRSVWACLVPRGGHRSREGLRQPLPLATRLPPLCAPACPSGHQHARAGQGPLTASHLNLAPPVEAHRPRGQGLGGREGPCAHGSQAGSCVSVAVKASVVCPSDHEWTPVSGLGRSWVLLQRRRGSLGGGLGVDRAPLPKDGWPRARLRSVRGASCFCPQGLRGLPGAPLLHSAEPASDATFAHVAVLTQASARSTRVAVTRWVVGTTYLWCQAAASPLPPPSRRLHPKHFARSRTPSRLPVSREPLICFMFRSVLSSAPHHWDPLCLAPQTSRNDRGSPGRCLCQSLRPLSRARTAGSSLVGCCFHRSARRHTSGDAPLHVSVWTRVFIFLG